MKVLIEKASDRYYKEIKEINTLEELLKIDQSLIIETDETTIDLYKRYGKIDCIVTIYDDYVE